MRQLLAIVFVLIAAMARADENEIAKLQGEWLAVEIHSDGLKRDGADKGVTGLKFVIKDDGLSIPHLDGVGQARRKAFKLDSTVTPKMIDIEHLDGTEAGETSYAIYKLENDRLTICMPYYGVGLKNRPNEFQTTAADGRMLIILERVK